MNIILLGNQASGKGTQGQLLAEKKGFFYLSTGQMFRNLSKTNQEIANIINAGDLLPDDLVTKCVSEYFEEKKVFDNIVLDGTPRSTYQYEKLKLWFESKGTKIDLAILINISKEAAIERLLARRTDKKTGKVYNLLTNPPGPEVDPADLVSRADATPESIEERFKLYEEVTKPLLEVLKSEGILKEVDGERPIEEINQDIIKFVQEKTV